MAVSARWLDSIPRAVSSTGNTRLRFSITPSSWVVTQVGLEFAWDGGSYTATIDGTETADGYVLPRVAGHYLMVIKGASVFAGATTLPAAVTITADVVVQNPSDSSESGTAVLTASTTIYAPPTVTITSPAEGATISALPLTITWDVTDDTGISGQRIQFYGIDDYFPDPAAREYTLPSDLVENDTSYFVEIVASNGVGLSSRDGVNFTTHWAPPATPTARTNRNPADLSVRITVFEGYIDGTEPATTSLMVTRINADGTRWVVASGLASGETCIDPLPPLGVEYSYAITAVTEAGTTSVATVACTVESRSWALNFGADAGEVLMLYGNPKSSYGLDQSGEAYHFADGGMGAGMPVWYGLADRDRSGSLSFDVIGPADADRLEALCDAHPVGWMRDPFGHRRHCVMTPKISHGVGQVWQLSISWDGVRWEEAW